MKSIFDIHDYDDNFLEQFTTQTIPIYDLWSIRPLQNDQKEIISGGSEDIEKFRNFILDHSSQEFPHPLVIVIGNSEKTNKERMSNTSKRYFKLKFEKYKGNDLGEPLTISGASQPYPVNNQSIMEFMGMPYSNINHNPNKTLQGFSLGDIHGIIDRNVADATRTIKAEYEEQAARREAESIKRLAEIETRMEMYKLDMRAREVENREQELKKELEELEYKKVEGLGSVRDYTKTIAGGILEFGKAALGYDRDLSTTNKKEAKATDKSNLGTTNLLDDDGFTKKSSSEENSENNLNIVLQGIANLNEEQKMALLEALIPESQSDDSIEKEIKEEQNQENKKSNKIKDNEDLPITNND